MNIFDVTLCYAYTFIFYALPYLYKGSTKYTFFSPQNEMLKFYARNILLNPYLLDVGADLVSGATMAEQLKLLSALWN